MIPGCARGDPIAHAHPRCAQGADMTLRSASRRKNFLTARYVDSTGTSRPVVRKEAHKSTFRRSQNGDQIWTWTEDYWIKENGDIFVPCEDQNAVVCKLARWFQHEFIPANNQMCYPDGKTTGESHVYSFSNVTRYRSWSRFVDH